MKRPSRIQAAVMADNPLRARYWSLLHLIRMVRDVLSWRFLRDRLASGAARSRVLAFAERAEAAVGTNVEVVGLERLHIGSATVIQSNVTLQCDGHDFTGTHGGIRIGRNGFVGHGCILYGAGGITIGDDALISPHVIIVSHQHSFDVPGVPMRLQPTRTAAVRIENNVWIGSGAVILPGVHLGAGCIVAAGAVVTSAVAAGTVVAGIPARPMACGAPRPNGTRLHSASAQ